MLGLVYDAAIQAQFDDHIGAAPHERTAGRRDQRNGTRTRGLNTRAGSLDLEIPRARNSNFKPTVIEHFDVDPVPWMVTDLNFRPPLAIGVQS